jgi:hypothetical protein
VAYTDLDPAVDGYALLVNGQPSEVVPSLVNGVVEFAHQGFATVGDVSLVVRAQRNGVTFDYTDPFTLSVVRRKIKIRR